MPQNYVEDRMWHDTLTRRAHLAEQTGAPRIMHTREDIRAHVSASQQKDKDERLTGGVGRPLGSAEPGLQRVQVHLGEESRPRHLITFHMCVWRETDLH